jgi:tetratricopeptide (TPR) repeat protein
VPLPARLTQLLILLIHSNGSVIDKETIASEIWPDCAVSDGNLSQHVYMLRQLLVERARDRACLVTVRGKGYRFVASVSVVAPKLPDRDACALDDRADELLSGSPEALHRYCRGSYLLEKRTASTLCAAAEEFEAVLRLDEEHVPALIGLARAYAYMAESCYAPASYAFPKAKAAIVRALEIDPSCAEARAALGMSALFCSWDWATAEREIGTAIALDPRSTAVYTCAAWFYICKGSSDRPLQEMRRALRVAPSSPPLQLFLARIFLHTAQYRRSIDAFSALLESGPDFSMARRYRAQALLLNGQPGEALADLLLLPQDRAEDVAVRLPLLGRAYAECGETERAESIYRALIETARTDYVAAFNLATVAIGLGRLEEALEHLERGVKEREPALLMLRSLPWFGPLEPRARFKAVLRSIWG